MGHVTVLIYLSSLEGGETLFPALPFHPAGPVSRTDALRELARNFGELAGAFNLEGSSRAKIRRKLRSLCDDLSGRTAGGQVGADLAEAAATQALAVRPEPGRAAVFWHEQVDNATSLADVFHAGCPVRKGSKLALQKFKSFST